LLNIYILRVAVILMVFCVISIGCICVAALTLVSIYLLIFSHKIESVDVATSLTSFVEIVSPMDLVVWQIQPQFLASQIHLPGNYFLRRILATPATWDGALVGSCYLRE